MHSHEPRTKERELTMDLSKIKEKLKIDKAKEEKILAFVNKWFNAKYANVYAWVAFGILFVLLAKCTASLFWSFWPDYRPSVSQASKASVNQQGPVKSPLEELLNTRFFPIPQAKMAMIHRSSLNTPAADNKQGGAGQSRPVADSGPARIPLEVTGILVSTIRAKSLCIIKYKNEESVYAEGDTIEGTKATVSRIFDSRVDIDNSGRLDSYQFVNDLGGKGGITVTGNESNRPSGAPDTAAERLSATGAPGVYKGNKIQANATMTMEDYVTISPVQEGRKILGYRLNPGRKGELFANVGFKPNDLAVVVNGFDLTDPEQTRMLFNERDKITDFEITVERDGVRENVYFSVSGEGNGKGK